ncbi:hypothetical protein ILYODFUR_026228 [Ilyodon furcidens]|uniref:Uncharacterized protein n=1 Tax=Ilyodon furcidens TaxID=33524 RepID=A0ABV0SRL9_9TELE
MLENLETRKTTLYLWTPLNVQEEHDKITPRTSHVSMSSMKTALGVERRNGNITNRENILSRMSWNEAHEKITNFMELHHYEFIFFTFIANSSIEKINCLSLRVK